MEGAAGQVALEANRAHRVRRQVEEHPAGEAHVGHNATPASRLGCLQGLQRAASLHQGASENVVEGQVVPGVEDLLAFA